MTDFCAGSRAIREAKRRRVEAVYRYNVFDAIVDWVSTLLRR